jgi:hypothetical protein
VPLDCWRLRWAVERHCALQLPRPPLQPLRLLRLLPLQQPPLSLRQHRCWKLQAWCPALLLLLLALLLLLLLLRLRVVRHGSIEGERKRSEHRQGADEPADTQTHLPWVLD